jgi:hypothetical protein
MTIKVDHDEYGFLLLLKLTRWVENRLGPAAWRPQAVAEDCRDVDFPRDAPVRTAIAHHTHNLSMSSMT